MAGRPTARVGAVPCGGDRPVRLPIHPMRRLPGRGRVVSRVACPWLSSVPGKGRIPRRVDSDVAVCGGGGGPPSGEECPGRRGAAPASSLLDDPPLVAGWDYRV